MRRKECGGGSPGWLGVVPSSNGTLGLPLYWINACSTITFTNLAQTGPGLWHLMHSYWNITPIETCFLVASPVIEVKIIATPQKPRVVLLSENSNM